MIALAGGASRGVSNEAAGVAVQCLGTPNTDLGGILVESIDAWTAGRSIDRDWSRYSVVGVMDASVADIGGAATAIWTWRRSRL